MAVADVKGLPPQQATEVALLIDEDPVPAPVAEAEDGQDDVDDVQHVFHNVEGL